MLLIIKYEHRPSFELCFRAEGSYGVRTLTHTNIIYKHRWKYLKGEEGSGGVFGPLDSDFFGRWICCIV